MYSVILTLKSCRNYTILVLWIGDGLSSKNKDANMKIYKTTILSFLSNLRKERNNLYTSKLYIYLCLEYISLLAVLIDNLSSVAFRFSLYIYMKQMY